jgi:hypothetical protein
MGQAAVSQTADKQEDAHQQESGKVDKKGGFPYANYFSKRGIQCALYSHSDTGKSGDDQR